MPIYQYFSPPFSCGVIDLLSCKINCRGTIPSLAGRPCHFVLREYTLKLVKLKPFSHPALTRESFLDTLCQIINRFWESGAWWFWSNRDTLLQRLESGLSPRPEFCK